MHLENQCLNPIYIHAKKKNVFLMHNKAYVVTKENEVKVFKVAQSKLMLDVTPPSIKDDITKKIDVLNVM